MGEGVYVIRLRNNREYYRNVVVVYEGDVRVVGVEIVYAGGRGKFGEVFECREVLVCSGRK